MKKSIEKLYYKYRLIIVLSLGVINMIGIGYFGLWRYTNSLTQKYEQVESLKTARSNLEEKLETVNQTRANLITYEQEIEALENKLPNSPETQDFVVKLTGETSKTGHGLISFRPSVKDSETTNLAVTIIGNKNNTTRLIKNLEQIERYHQIESIETALDKQDRQNISIRMEIYNLDI